jgi:5-methylcytosine-specific restriction endonuclease McrA
MKGNMQNRIAIVRHSRQKMLKYYISQTDEDIGVPMEYIGLIVVFAIIVLAFAILMIMMALDKKHTAIVMAHSSCYKALCELNQKTKFISFQAVYTYHRNCNSKREFDRTSADEIFKTELATSTEYFKHLITQVEQNIATNQAYCKQYDSLQSSVTEKEIKGLRISLKRFKKIEDKLKQKNKVIPLTEVTVTCSYSYVSPQGRNRYSDGKSYNFALLRHYCWQVENDIRQRSTREYMMRAERSKMTDSLRYDILKRDDFRCQICGAEQKDGVKLHVDHIIPVARGGLTQSNNLRTLCERCNMGKKDKV